MRSWQYNDWHRRARDQCSVLSFPHGSGTNSSTSVRQKARLDQRGRPNQEPGIDPILESERTRQPAPLLPALPRRHGSNKLWLCVIRGSTKIRKPSFHIDLEMIRNLTPPLANTFIVFYVNQPYPSTEFRLICQSSLISGKSSSVSFITHRILERL